MIQSRFLFTAFVLLTILITPLTRASELGFWYTGANPDYKPFSTDYNFGLTWEQQLTDDSAFSLMYNDTDFNPSGPVVGSIRVNSWVEVGYEYFLAEDLYVMASYTTVDTTRGTEDGFGIHIGYDIDWTDSLYSSLQFGLIDTGFSDYQLIGSLNYELTEQFEIAFKLRDYHEWDYTSYEFGVIFSF